MSLRRLESTAPERWRVDAGDADIAVLDVPPVLVGDRVFEVDVRFEVRVPERDAVRARHALSVEIDGRQQWARELVGRHPGETDSIDYRCSCTVPAGQPLRIRAVTRVGGSRRQRLLIEAEVG